MTPAAILFDFGGTLDADGIAWKDRFQALFAQEGLDVPGGQFDRAFYSADDSLVGTLPRDFQLTETVDRLSYGVAMGLSADAGVAERVADRFLEDARAKLEGNAVILERLSERFRLGVVSNFYGNLAAVCAGTSLGRHLDVIIDSATVGFEKPDPRIFQAALSVFQVAAGGALFIGDSMRRDMAGARNLGMPHVWLKPGAREGCCPGDVVIDSLARLSQVLS